MPTTTQTITIRSLTPALAEEYAHFFDGTPHNNEFGQKCYCVTWRGDESYNKNGDHWFNTEEERREKAISFVKSGALKGYLAYMGDEIVGWCNANANCQHCRDYLRGFWNIDEYDPAVKIKSVFCFAIAPEMQRRGVATQLLQRVCHDAAEENYDFVEAYTSVDFAHDGFHGPLALYEKCGFVRYSVKDDYVVMRKTLKK
jgi:GNAT superfamily N-acetyltransferase